MWLVNDEMKVLFEYKLPEGQSQLMSGPVNLVLNKELVQQYLDSMDNIPHIRKITTLESTAGLQVLDC